MKFLTAKDLVPIILIIAAFAFGLAQYSSLPDQIPSHWNARGEIDQYSSKTFGVLFMPLLALGLYFLLSALPFIDPLRENFKKFGRVYFWIKVAMAVFMVGIYLASLYAAKGVDVSMATGVKIAISLLFIFLGAVMGKIRKNYFVGIRTPWTLANEEVWDRTHKFGGTVFLIAGCLGLLGALLPNDFFFVVIGAILGAVLVVTVYSYVIFVQLRRKQGAGMQKI